MADRVDTTGTVRTKPATEPEPTPLEKAIRVCEEYRRGACGDVNRLYLVIAQEARVELDGLRRAHDKGAERELALADALGLRLEDADIEATENRHEGGVFGWMLDRVVAQRADLERLKSERNTAIAQRDAQAIALRDLGKLARAADVEFGDLEAEVAAASDYRAAVVRVCLQAQSNLIDGDKALAEYREWLVRLGRDPNEQPTSAVMWLGAERDAHRKRAEQLQAERDEWKRSAEMACQSPPDGCDCPGCTLADDAGGDRG